MKRIASFALVLIAAVAAMLPFGAKTPDSEIKYAEFNVSYSALEQALNYDIKSQSSEHPLNWTDLLAVLGARYGGDFSRYKSSHMKELAERLSSGESIEDIADNKKHLDYYRRVYSAVLGGLVGEYTQQFLTEDGGTETKVCYGLKAYSPIAATFPYSHYSDFGASRTYGYSRRHLGHDLLAATGTPVVAIESGTVECMGWNQYGGWRIGIRSFDRKRYYYYAHLRQNRPYHCDLNTGETVSAGDVIGYVGRTGYSAKENVNGIETSHLHLGLQLVFDESQKESDNEIWVDIYALTKLLYRHKSETVRVAQTKEFFRKYGIDEPGLVKSKQNAAVFEDKTDKTVN